MKPIIIFIMLIFLIGCYSVTKPYSFNLDNVYLTIDGELAWNYMCDRKPGCVYKFNKEDIDYFFIYSVEDNEVIGHEINHILRYKQTGIWNERNE